MLIFIRNGQRWLVYVYGFTFLFNLIANRLFIPNHTYFASAAIAVATELLNLMFFIAVFFHLNRTKSKAV